MELQQEAAKPDVNRSDFNELQTQQMFDSFMRFVKTSTLLKSEKTKKWQVAEMSGKKCKVHKMSESEDKQEAENEDIEDGELTDI